jgi:hypothetical protein
MIRILHPRGLTNLTWGHVRTIRHVDVGDELQTVTQGNRGAGGVSHLCNGAVAVVLVPVVVIVEVFVGWDRVKVKAATVRVNCATGACCRGRITATSGVASSVGVSEEGHKLRSAKQPA